MCLRQSSTKYVQNVLLLSTKLLLSHDRVTKPQKPQRLPTIVTRERSSLSRCGVLADPYSTPLQPSIGSCTSGSERFYACRLCRLPMQNALLLRGSLPAWGVGCLLGSSSQSPSPFCFSVHLHHPSPQASKPPLRTELHAGWWLSKMQCNATVPFVASAFTAASQLTHITTCKHATAIPSHSIHIPFQPSAVQADPDPRPPTAVTHDPPSSPSKNRASKPRPGLA